MKTTTASLGGSPRAQQAKVLIVDDEPLVGELLLDLLKIFGCDPEYCCVPSEALQKLEHEEFHLILLDCRMPGMNGAQFYQEVASGNPQLAKRIVFLTGDTHSDEIQYLLRHTGRMHLGKPFQFERIKALLDRALESAHAELSVAPVLQPVLR
jgi:CheY-like chemotaxis protein